MMVTGEKNKDKEKQEDSIETEDTQSLKCKKILMAWFVTIRYLRVLLKSGLF